MIQGVEKNMNYATKMTAVAATATALLFSPFERIVSSLYQPNRSMLTGTDIGNMAGAAYAQDKVAAATKTSNIQYKTVDDILKGTPFKIVDVDAYKREIQSNSRVVAFHYRNDMTERADGKIAEIYREIFQTNPEAYSNLTFLALKSESGKDELFLSLGFEVTPHILYFFNGKRSGSVKRGPANQDEAAATRKLLHGHLEKLSTYQVSSK